jgi:hypothetical protein
MGFVVLSDRERTMVEREVKKLSNDDSDRDGEYCGTIPHPNTVSIPKPSNSVISAFLQSVGHDSNVTKAKRASLIDEFRRYRLLASKFTDSREDYVSALQFWSTYGTSLPILSSFARRFLSTPGTSVPSETAFSASSFIGRKERCRLTPENLAMTMFLRDKLLVD